MLRKITNTLYAVTIALPVLLANVGCETDKDVLDVETPAGEIDVEQDRDTGSIEVEVEEK